MKGEEVGPSEEVSASAGCTVTNAQQMSAKPPSEHISHLLSPKTCSKSPTCFERMHAKDQTKRPSACDRPSHPPGLFCHHLKKIPFGGVHIVRAPCGARTQPVLWIFRAPTSARALLARKQSGSRGLVTWQRCEPLTRNSDMAHKTLTYSCVSRAIASMTTHLRCSP